MSTQVKTNAEIVKAYFDAFAKGDVGAIDRYFTPDVEYLVNGTTEEVGESREAIPWTGTFHGREGAKEFFSHLQKNIEVIGFTPQIFIEQGDAVAVFGMFKYRALSTGKEFDSNYSIRIQMRDGQIALYHFLENTYAVAAGFRTGGSWTLEMDGQSRNIP